jgi:hypothetical protein
MYKKTASGEIIPLNPSDLLRENYSDSDNSKQKSYMWILFILMFVLIVGFVIYRYNNQN